MPTVFRSGPDRLFFYSADGHELHHVHVQRDELLASFGRTEINRIEQVIMDKVNPLLEGWNEFSETERSEATALTAQVTDDSLTVDLVDGRTITVPVAWFPRLKTARQPSVQIGVLLETATAFIGQIWTRISASRVC